MCSINVTDGIALLRAGLDALAEADPADLDGVGLGDQLADLQQASSRLTAQIVGRVAVFHTRGDAAAFGMLSTGSFLSYWLHLSHPEARTVLSLARQLPDLPGTAAALAAGNITAGQAAVIAVGAARIGVEHVAAAEPILLQAADTLEPGGLRKLIQHLRYVLDPGGADQDAAKAFDRRGLDASTTLDGMVDVDGLLDPDTGAALLTALNSGGPPAAEDPRTAAQRRADRLGEILRCWLGTGAGGTAGGLPVQVTLTADLDTLRGTPGAAPAYLDWIGPLDLTTARLLGCDCQITGVITDTDGTPLNVGWKHRTATGPQRTALAVRDRHCHAPGCDRPPAFCDAHHVQPWYAGGRTDLTNLILLCRRHHRAVHAGVWTIHVLEPGRFRFVHTDRPPQRRPHAA